MRESNPAYNTNASEVKKRRDFSFQMSTYLPNYRAMVPNMADFAATGIKNSFDRYVHCAAKLFQFTWMGVQQMPNGNQSGNISQDELNKMLKLASSKLGMSPDQLRGVLSDKKATDDLLGRIGGQSKLDAALRNPESLEKMVSQNPKARKMLSDLLGENKHG